MRFSNGVVAGTRCARLLLAACLLVGCTGSKTPLPGADDHAYVKIDDMEGDSGRIEWLPPPGAEATVPGRWDTQAGTQCGDIEPRPSYLGGSWEYADVPQPYATFRGVTSERAARLRTTAPLLNTWGATLAFDFAKELPEVDAGAGTPPPSDAELASCTVPAGVTPEFQSSAVAVDLRMYRGVTFFARAVEGAGASSIFVKLHDQNTDQRGRVCDPVVGSDRECYNAFGARVTLTAEFRRYSVDFADFVQQIGWGYRPPERAADLEHVYSLVFEIRTPGGTCDPPRVCPGPPPQLTFDVWIDDLYFVER